MPPSHIQSIYVPKSVVTSSSLLYGVNSVVPPKCIIALHLHAGTNIEEIVPILLEAIRIASRQSAYLLLCNPRPHIISKHVFWIHKSKVSSLRNPVYSIKILFVQLHQTKIAPYSVPVTAFGQHCISSL